MDALRINKDCIYSKLFTLTCKKGYESCNSCSAAEYKLKHSVSKPATIALPISIDADYTGRCNIDINGYEINLGDTVKVLRKARDKELGWTTWWADNMDSAVGRLGIVRQARTSDGCVLDFKDNTDISGFVFPGFVLGKQ
jgi:hypothetical protein